MRKLMLLLIAFIAVVTFIRAFDRSDVQNNLSRQASIETRPEAMHNN
jgi:hypothetical protein